MILNASLSCFMGQAYPFTIQFMDHNFRLDFSLFTSTSIIMQRCYKFIMLNCKHSECQLCIESVQDI